MTEKRFVGNFQGKMLVSIRDKKNNCNVNILQIVEIANELSNENEQLKQAYQTLKHRHSLLHDVCIEAECDRDRYHKDVVSLEKENEKLKREIKRLKCINKQLEERLDRDIALNMDCGDAE